MKKILIRAGISPLEEIVPEKMIARNSIGNNAGNLIYQYGIFRLFHQKNVKMVPDYYGVENGMITSEDAEYINKEYSAYICPLADAFRSNFVKNLKLYTKLIKNLKIPFIVTGVGLKTSLKNRKRKSYPFDDEVIGFVNEVTKTGTIIGVRGKITANYLSNLGFKENEDFMKIGCPSMYSFGKDLKIKEKEITEKSTISINSSLKSRKFLLKFISNNSEEFTNKYFIPQWLSEFKLTYFGEPQLKKESKYYPTNIKSEMYEKNLVRFPVSAYGWINFLKSVDLSFGARLHGNIASTLAGTPSIVFIKDGRMKEVADYHNLTKISLKQLKRYNNLKEIIEDVDFHSPEVNHEKRYKNYLNFWEKNGLKNLIDSNISRKETPFDKKIKHINNPPLETIPTLNKEDYEIRLKKYEYEKKKWKKEVRNNVINKKIKYIKKQPTIRLKLSAMLKASQKYVKK